MFSTNTVLNNLEVKPGYWRKRGTMFRSSTDEIF